MVLESVLVSFFYKWLTSFTSTTCFPLYILASFVEDKVSVGTWIYLWVFYFVPLIYISVFVPAPYCLDDCVSLPFLCEYFQGLLLSFG